MPPDLVLDLGVTGLALDFLPCRHVQRRPRVRVLCLNVDAPAQPQLDHGLG